MSFNLNKGFDFDNGLIFNNPETGESEGGLISFKGNPIGSPAPVGTICKDPRGLIWRKYALPDNDWEIIDIDRAAITIKPTEVSGVLSFLEYYNSLTQIPSNRIARADYTYSSGFLETEVTQFYDTDGVTVIQTVTYTFTYSAGVLTNAIKS